MLAIVCCFIIMIAYMSFKAKENHLTKHIIKFDKFPKSFHTINIFFISDIHRRIVSDKLLETIPPAIDFVVIGGDLTESGVPFKRVEQNIKRLKKIAPVFFVFGNNDYEVGKERLESFLLKQGITILNNSAAFITSQHNEKLAILGVEDMTLERDKLDLAVRKAAQADFKLLISHNPDIYHKVDENAGISLILSGHTHGGQIRLFGFGLYEKGKIHFLKKATLLISNGYGTSGIPLRLGAPAEAHYIQLKANQ